MRARTISASPEFPMPSIDITHDHNKTPAQARKAVEQVAKKLAERFEVDCGWDGDTLSFNRAGVDGKIELLPQALRVTADLGFMLSMMKGPIEAEIRRVLSEKFA